MAGSARFSGMPLSPDNVPSLSWCNLLPYDHVAYDSQHGDSGVREKPFAATPHFIVPVHVISDDV